MSRTTQSDPAAMLAFPSLRTPRSAAASISLAVSAMLLQPAAVHAGNYFDGEQVYRDQCRECHGPDGRGLAAGAPDFSRGEGLMRSETALFRSIADGAAGMPGFKGILADDEILDVITYVRTLQR